uniref:Acyl-CoA dehydrogenase n=1 Tax=Arcella intermedia TaxID=1963864 RepID=A0A6B2L5I5_9EUKA
MIYWDEISRCGSGGICAAVFLTIGIALPPILAEGSDYLKNKVARDVITGKKIIALALTEPGVGSDLANLETTAVRSGDHYVINGSKKFITSGMKADYFVLAARTGGNGMGGVSLILVEAKTPGIKLTRLPTQGWVPSNTALIVFEDVKVPVENLIGEENNGFRAIMVNFNHERWVGIIMSSRACRMAVEESIKYAQERKTFGKKLIQHQVLRHKLAEMITRVEIIQSQLEYLTYQMKMGISPLEIGANIAFLKVYTTKTMELCAREASQIFGGNSFLRTGRGAGIERFYREVRVSAIGGGSEEVMTDLGLRLSKL